MAELCDICVLPLVGPEAGGSRCNHCWEVTSRLKAFLGAPTARKLVAATLAEIGCAPPVCPGCRTAVRLAEAYNAYRGCSATRESMAAAPKAWTGMRAAEREWKKAQHADDCSNQERP